MGCRARLLNLRMASGVHCPGAVLLGRGDLHTGGSCNTTLNEEFNRQGGHLSVWGAQRREGSLVPGVTPEGFSWGCEPCVGFEEQVGHPQGGILGGKASPTVSHMGLENGDSSPLEHKTRGRARRGSRWKGRPSAGLKGAPMAWLRGSCPELQVQ